MSALARPLAPGLTMPGARGARPRARYAPGRAVALPALMMAVVALVAFQLGAEPLAGQRETALVQWAGCTSACVVTEAREMATGVADAFTYDVSYESDRPLTIRFFTMEGFVRWEGSCRRQPACLAPGDLATQTPPATSLSHFAFHLAEGCAGYIAVFAGLDARAVTFRPYARLLYRPSNTATGVCAGA